MAYFSTSQKIALRLVAQEKKIILFKRFIVNNHFKSLIFLLTF